MTLVKICGLSTVGSLDAALASGADMVGFVRFPRSPRHVELDLGRTLSARAQDRATRVLLMVDPTDEALAESVAALGPDMIQLHGSETPARVAAVKALTGQPVMKALAIGEASDIAKLRPYQGIADRLLLDAKPPKGAVLPGGNGVAFDWHLLAGLTAPPLCAALGQGAALPGLDPGRDLMLSGGLTPDTVAEAIRISGLSAVDVSSGVESAPGVKDETKIAAFIRAAKAALPAEYRRAG